MTDALIPFVVRPRGNGKTTRAVEWVKEDPQHRAIVTATAHQARELRGRYDLSERQVVVAGSGLRGRKVDVAVDDAELILARLLGANSIGMVTATGESI